MTSGTGKKRTRMLRPYPTHTIEDSLAIPKSIHEHNAGLPFDRKLLARALGTTPASSSYTMRLNSSAKYGFTQGGYNDDQISLTSRGQAIVAPKDAAELQKSLVDAAMQPDIFGKFYRLMDGKKLPEDTYVQNLLQREFGIHQELTSESLEIIKANGLYVGIITNTGGSLMVRVPGARQAASGKVDESQPSNSATTGTAASPTDCGAQATGKVFIGHNFGTSVVDALESLLSSFDIAYVVSGGSDQASGLISPQVSAEMKECTAAVIVITSGNAENIESRRTPRTDSMIYQLGAASVLYGSRILILKEHEIELNFDTSGVRCAEIDSRDGGIDPVGLLKEMHIAGVLRVTA